MESTANKETTVWIRKAQRAMAHGTAGDLYVATPRRSFELVIG
jgi:hypothetical protein